MELLETQLSDSKQTVDQLELQLIQLQGDNKTLESQLVSVQVGEVDEGLIQVQCLCIYVLGKSLLHNLHNMWLLLLIPSPQSNFYATIMICTNF